MVINKIESESTIILEIEGRLDTVTSIQLSGEFDKIFNGITSNLVLDFKNLDYISSAGLRVLLTAQKQVTSLGTTMEIVGANDSVNEVFKITGFYNILNIT